MDSLTAEITQACARLIAEEGLDYGAAKQRAVRQLGLPERTRLPDNDSVEAALEEYLALFCADTQPQELKLLRLLAADWLECMQAFSPQLSGAVWRGTATRWSDIHIQLYCDDPKSPEWWLLDRGVRHEVRTVSVSRGRLVEVLSVQVICPAFHSYVGVHMTVNDSILRRGSLLPDVKGRPVQGTLEALRRLLKESDEQ